jgi:hypothetical protein
MNSNNKKGPGARGVAQPFNRQAGHAPQLKPVIAQLKTGVSAQSLKRPIAPPVYKPQPQQKVAQAKTSVALAKAAVSTQGVKRPIAPPVYRPQQIPKVLQTMTATPHRSRSGPAPRRPVVAPDRHPEQKRIAQLKMAVKAAALTPPGVARSFSGFVIQRAEIEMLPFVARTATCQTIGVQHENGKSFASVHSIATHLQETDRAIYEIAWDAAVAPVGHEGMAATANVASDFVVDRSQSGEAIGNCRRHYRRDGANGWVFEFRDGIEWPADLNGGRWRFRLRVVNGAGTEKARSAEAIVDWNH